jgi:hypothetical protein
MTVASVPLNGEQVRSARVGRVACGAGWPVVEIGAAGAFAPRQELAGLWPEVQRHAELDLATLRYHLEQSDATAADGYWHAAINEARSFLEALVVGMAQAERQESFVAFRKGKESQGGLRLSRRFLVDVGFLGPDEDELLLHVYGIASAKGAHHGVADAAWSRLARRIIWTTAQYLLRRYETWKRTAPERRARRVCGATAPPPAPPMAGFWRRWRAWLGGGGR